jgi:hypothetical protein
MAVIRRAGERTLWSCMACGSVGDRQSCHACGAEAMPGAWVPADRLAGAVSALESIRDRLEPFVKGGEPAAEDAVDIYEIAAHAINQLRGQYEAE